MRMKKRCCACARKQCLTAMMVFLLIFLLPAAGLAQVEVQTGNVLHEMSGQLYGLFIEDISDAVDGGLYAELTKNGSFEWQSILNAARSEHYEAWTIRPGGRGEIADERPISENNPTYLHVTGGDVPVEAMNQGFGGNALRGGIHLSAGAAYDLSLFARAGEEGFEGMVTLCLMTKAGEVAGDTVEIAITDSWTRTLGQVTAPKDMDTVLCVTVEGSGSVDIDMASVMPADRFGADMPGGGFRADLVEALRELNPSFLRFPGGCVAEGSYVRDNMYNWKNTVGALEMRRQIPNTWGGMQTNGVGFYEYFCLAESMGALPVPVVHAGLLCQARDVYEPPYTMEEMAAYVQDVLDLIEFATGGEDTVWGGLRCEMGHPAPFDLRYLALGNENWDNVYFTRYQILSDAVKAACPDITCIVAAGPVAEGSLIQDSWRRIRRDFSDSLVDEHYYMESDWLLKNTDRYDRYSRDTKVFLGEFAAHEALQGSRRPNNLHEALCEAAYMTGLERNSDVVQMACYAPLLAREGAQDWTPDLIWFDETRVVRTPSWYVQQMFSEVRGDVIVACDCEDEDVYVSASRTQTEVQLKIVSLREEGISLPVTVQAAADGVVTGTVLTGESKAVNSLTRPDKIQREEVEMDVKEGEFTVSLAAPGVLVLRIPLQ